MNNQKVITVSHLAILILGLLFYTSIGLLFVIPYVPLRLLVFLLLLIVANFKKQHYVIILVACIFGLIINFSIDWQTTISNALSWGALAGCILGSILISENMFSGSDFASISKFFKEKNKIAIHSFYAFKIIPMILFLLDRLSKSYMVYGKKKYIAKKEKIKFKVIIDVIDSFFCDLLVIMFSQERIINRRTAIAFVVSQGKRIISLKMFVVELVVLISVLIVSLSYFLKDIL